MVQTSRSITDLSIIRQLSTGPMRDHPSPLHHVSYYCLDSSSSLPCRTYHLHIMRQANVILNTKQIVG
jgi:hypothetical protein